MKTLEQYASALFKLFPQGYAVPEYADDSNLKTLFETIGHSLLAADYEADVILDNLFPDNAGIFLNDWERVLGLPLPGLESLTTTQRLGLIKTWLNIGELSNAAFFVDIAAAVGYTITVTEFTPASPPPAPAVATDACLYFQINAPAQTEQYFIAGVSRAGDVLVDYGNDALEYIIKFFKPAHAVVIFDYT